MATREKKAPSTEDRKDMRAHSEDGSVRPADGRWPLHDPADESKVVRSPHAAGETPKDGKDEPR